MSGSRLIRAADAKPIPWKNGGGVTVEIAVSPDGAGYADFDWRVSMATVAVDGPFSSFPGIDRTLTVLDGAGLSLAVDGRAPALLRPGSPPFAFPGDAPCHGALTDGPVTDFNVMTRRGRLRHSVARRGAGRIERPAALVAALLFCAGRQARVDGEGLGRHDTLRADEAGWSGWTVEAETGTCLLVLVERA